MLRAAVVFVGAGDSASQEQISVVISGTRLIGQEERPEPSFLRLVECARRQSGAERVLREHLGASVCWRTAKSDVGVGLFLAPQPSPNHPTKTHAMLASVWRCRLKFAAAAGWLKFRTVRTAEQCGS